MTYIIVDRGQDQFLAKEIKNFLKIHSVKEVKRFDVFETEAQAIIDHASQLFDHYQISDQLDQFDPSQSFRYRLVLGQFNQTLDSTLSIIHHQLALQGDLKHSMIIVAKGVNELELQKIKEYFINEIEYELLPFGPVSWDMGRSDFKNLAKIEGFRAFTDPQLEELLADLAMDLEDIRLVQQYFIEEGVDPTYFQIQVIDTYWSDHCRHTTFFTELDEVEVLEGDYQAEIQATLADYQADRQSLYSDGRPMTLMSLATINAKLAKRKGWLTNQDESDEVNACAVRVDVDVDGEAEDYLLYFKNETHNHPTEIEPYGGAATCIGGGIRDPLSGRSYVHQALRITGAGNPLTDYDDTLENKLPQRVITQKAAQGYSDYGNDIGQTAGYLREYYDDGFVAKRMELGALVAAAPVDSVFREKPMPGDRIILLGGETGRDGVGAAVGSSKVQTEDSLQAQGAEVQKGNPFIERKIIRLFRQPEATRLIIKCNDFGAGGVSVAIGELADGLRIDLNQVPVKYLGLDPSEIALSESQERMAVVVREKDVEAFIQLANAEDLDAVVVAEVTEDRYMVMDYNGEEVLRLSRDFLNTNGSSKHAKVKIAASSIQSVLEEGKSLPDQLQSIHGASQKALIQNFDSTIGKGTLLAPLGGRYQLTPQLGMAALMPVLEGHTTTASVMAPAYYPKMAKQSPFHAGYYAVLNAIARVVALGVNPSDVYLTMQEYFERLEADPIRWGKPTGALLGAYKAMKQTQSAALGGKDSMSGTYEGLNVPPSVISIAVGISHCDHIVSRELKQTDSKLWLLTPDLDEGDVYKEEVVRELLESVSQLVQSGQARAISTLDDQTLEHNLVEMALGNQIGVSLDPAYLGQKYPLAFIIETDSSTMIPEGHLIGSTQAHRDFVADQRYSLAELERIYTQPLADVFTEIDLIDQPLELDQVAPFSSLEPIQSSLKVLIPVMTGTNGEYDLYQSFKEYTDQVDFYVIKESIDYAQSIKELKDKLADYDILALPDGMIQGNQTEFGKSVEFLLQDLGEELERFIKDNYVLGIGASFAGLIRSGLIEFSRLQAGTQIRIQKNPYDKTINEIVSATVIRPSIYAGVGQYHTALASKWLAVDCDDSLESQVISRFNRFLAGHSAIDAMMDSTGHVFGSIGNFERFSHKGLVNQSIHQAPFIQGLVQAIEGERK